MHGLARTAATFLVGLGFWMGCTSRGGAAVPAYLFVDFEESIGWKAGALPREGVSVRLIQGEARVVAVAEEDSQQVLEIGPSTPFPAVQVDASPIARSKVVFAEVLARPFAVDEQADEEFFDFGGAVLGFFRVGDRGEIRALFGRTKEESVWISTGVQFDVDVEGRASRWLRIGVRLDRTSGRWAVTINGTERLVGLRVVPPPEGSGLALWLYGHAENSCRFDDVLLSTVEAGHLEKMLAWQARRRESLAGELGVSRPKTVTQAKPTAELRHQQAALREVRPVAPVLRDWHLTLKVGTQTYQSGRPTLVEGREISITAHGLDYDDEGKPLPGVITIVADAELRPGTDLSRLRWRVAELKNWPDEIGDIAGRGDFQSGLVQTFAVTSGGIL